MSAAQLAAIQPRIKSPFFEGLAPLEVETVLAAARECHFRAGAVIASQGTPANSVFLLVRGRARFFILTPDGHKILLMWLPAGEIIGGAAMQCRPSDYIVSTETVKDSTMLIWDRPTIRRLAGRYPQLIENVLVTAAEYLTFYVATHVAWNARRISLLASAQSRACSRATTPSGKPANLVSGRCHAVNQRWHSAC
ncbi:MAG TPA: cyclic nucleotide-binding domain-containing protein [Candidatus Angelobacter sp.]|nr:cyclic nucleotide-binding domain-containing protein [Candidatus Angelobacter sp.]